MKKLVYKKFTSLKRGKLFAILTWNKAYKGIKNILIGEDKYGNDIYNGRVCNI